MQTVREIRADWLAHLLSTEPADRAHTESAVRELYVASELSSPQHIFRFDSPLLRYGRSRY
jgi:hypothetical protein